MRTPAARPRDRWLELAPGDPVVARFRTPVRKVVLHVHGQERTLRFAHARRTVDVGLSASAHERAGSVSVSAAPRAWERTPEPTRLSWFPPRPRAQALVQPAAGVELAPDRPDHAHVLAPGARRSSGRACRRSRRPHPAAGTCSTPTRSPSSRAGSGIPLSGHVEVQSPGTRRATPGGRPEQAHERSPGTCVTGRSCGSSSCSPRRATSRVDWSPAADPPATHRPRRSSPPPPTRRRDASTGATRTRRTSCVRSGGPGEWNEIVRGAVMMFQHDHGLDVDAFVGPEGLAAPSSPTRSPGRRAHRRLQLRLRPPQRAAVAHPLAQRAHDPQLAGQHRRAGGADPARHLPGLRAHPDRDDERHEPRRHPLPRSRHPLDQLLQPRRRASTPSPRASFGTPQSLGCVELPLAAAAKVWPYTPIGTLVTVEN